MLARRVLTRDEVPNCKLATLAPFFRAATTPNHRALDDARATVDVLHGLIARLGNLGVHSLPELRAFTAQVTEAQRRKRHLADGLPTGPGVYIFRDGQGRPLYVGTSRSIRARVRQYFVSSETRSRMGEMVGLAERVDPIECAHSLEAQVRELRLIAAHKPRYNRRSKFPERSVWLKLTVEPFPRLSIVRERRGDGASYLGPLRSQRQAEAVRDAIHDAVPLRQCSDRLSLRRAVRAACVLAGIGRCGAPCEGGTSPQQYAALVGPGRRGLGRRRPAAGRAARAQARRAGAGAALRAGRRRPRPHRHRRPRVRPDAAAVGAARGRRARRRASRRRRRLGAVGRARGPAGRRRARRPRACRRGRSSRRCAPRPTSSTRATSPLAEESECILRWLEEPGTRLAWASDPWAMPAFGAGRPARLPGRRRASRSIRSPTAAGCRWSAAPARARAERRRDEARDHRDRDDCRPVRPIPEVAEAIADLEGVSEVYSVAGDVDLIAIVRVREFDAIADVIAGRISKVDGVVHTDTHIAFRAYSRHDLESTFSIGIE